LRRRGDSSLSASRFAERRVAFDVHRTAKTPSHLGRAFFFALTLDYNS
jgi:hypothetical protein